MKMKIFAAITLFALSITITINARADDIHSVWIEKPYRLYDGDTGIHYNPDVTIVTINWKENTLLGFFNAKAEVGKTTYQFQLVSISNSDEREIEGFWDIWRNGTLVCSGCVGKAYGLDGDIGNYSISRLNKRHHATK